jgi:site-specific DNA-methyltransferase (adenine-specific)/adenine-specific DNA-methyltransferase
LIYIDPPFKSNADYVRKVELRGLKNLGGIEEDEADILQQTMYFDIWNNDTYLQFMYESLLLMRELLSDTGSIYVHLYWHAGHYIYNRPIKGVH